MTALSDHRHFTAAKLAWQARIIVDPDLGQLARLLACHLTHMFGKSHTTWPAQETLARALSVTVRSIRRATEELVKAGYLKVRISRGRGKANIYAPVLSAALDSVPSGPSHSSGQVEPEPAAEKRTPGSSIAGKKRTWWARKADSGVPPTLSVPESTPLPPSSRVQAGQPRGATAKRFAEEAVRQVVARALGEPATVSYLDPAVWRPDDRTIICRLGIAAKALHDRIGRDLDRIGIRIVHDPESHQALSVAVPGEPDRREDGAGGKLGLKLIGRPKSQPAWRAQSFSTEGYDGRTRPAANSHQLLILAN